MESPLSLTTQPVVPRLVPAKVRITAALILGVIGLSVWSAMTKADPPQVVAPMRIIEHKAMPSLFDQAPVPSTPVQAAPVVVPPQVQQQSLFRPATQPKPAPPPKPPRQPTAAEIAYKEALASSPLPQRGDQGGVPQTLEIAAQQQAKNEYTLDGTLHPSPSPYLLQAGTTIPALLQTGISSELPGPIFAQVSQNVFDSVKMDSLLIPQGAKLQGKYEHEVAQGQRRVLVVWDRVLYPNGSSLLLAGMPGAEPEGYAGLSDKVNNHFGQLFGRALLFSAISAGTGIAQGGFRGNGFYDSYSPADAATSAVGREFGQAANESIRRGSQIPPTLEIRPGFPFVVMVTKDISFKEPYKQ